MVLYPAASVKAKAKISNAGFGVCEQYLEERHVSMAQLCLPVCLVGCGGNFWMTHGLYRALMAVWAVKSSSLASFQAKLGHWLPTMTVQTVLFSTP
jgi:hypothetical protein